MSNMKPTAHKFEYYDSGDICELVEHDAEFKHDLWYYWTQAGYEINSGTITAVLFDLLLDELKNKQEHGLAANLEQLMKEIDPEELGVFVGYFW